MYIRGISMAIVNCTKAVRLIFSFIVSIQKLIITFFHWFLISFEFKTISAVF